MVLSKLLHSDQVVESFIGRFKEALRVHFGYWEHDNLHDVIAQAVCFFNHVRPIREASGKPPVPFRAGLMA